MTSTETEVDASFISNPSNNLVSGREPAGLLSIRKSFPMLIKNSHMICCQFQSINLSTLQASRILWKFCDGDLFKNIFIYPAKYMKLNVWFNDSIMRLPRNFKFYFSILELKFGLNGIYGMKYKYKTWIVNLWWNLNQFSRLKK